MCATFGSLIWVCLCNCWFACVRCSVCMHVGLLLQFLRLCLRDLLFESVRYALGCVLVCVYVLHVYGSVWLRCVFN